MRWSPKGRSSLSGGEVPATSPRHASWSARRKNPVLVSAVTVDNRGRSYICTKGKVMMKGARSFDPVMRCASETRGDEAGSGPASVMTPAPNRMEVR
jgi:hypothetical protein